ncbi:O-antigen ligase family protein [Sinomonas atrocyanea]
MSDSALLIFSGLLISLVWGAVYLDLAGQPRFNSYRALCIVIGGAVFAGCAVTVAPRLGIGQDVAANVAFVVACVIVAVSFATGIARRGKADGPDGGMLFTCLAIAGWLLVSFFMNGYSLERYLNPLVSLFIPVAIVVMTRATRASRDHLLQLAFRCTAGIVYVSLTLAVVAPGLAFGTSDQDMRRIVVMGLSERLSGVAGHPNLLAIFAVVLFVMAYSLPVRRKALHLVAGIAVLFLTESRTGLVAFVFAVAVMWVWQNRTPLRILFAVAMVTASTIVLTMWFDDSSNALTSDVETNGRYRVWDLVLGSLPDRLIYGWGPVAFRADSGTPLLEAGLGHAHSQFFQALAEGGIVGFGLLVLLLVQFLLTGRNALASMYIGLAATVISASFTEVILDSQLWGANIGMVPTLVLFPAFLSARRSPDPSVWERRGSGRHPQHGALTSFSTEVPICS